MSTCKCKKTANVPVSVQPVKPLQRKAKPGCGCGCESGAECTCGNCG